MKRYPGRRSKKGAVLAEATASTVVYVCLVAFVTFAVVEICTAVHIMLKLNQAAREAARELSMLYIKSGGGQQPGDSSISEELQKIVVPGVVNDPSQFTVTWPTSYPKNPHPPLTVSVICTAAPGQTGQSSSTPNIMFPGAAMKFFSYNFSLSGLTLKSSAIYPLRP